MNTVKEKVSNAASTAKEKADIYKAKVEEKSEKAAATTKEEIEIAEQRRKAKEAKAKMELHMAKAEHAAEKLHDKQTRHGIGGLCCGGGQHNGVPHQHNPLGPAATATTATSHPLGGHHHNPLGTLDPASGTNATSYPLEGHHHNPVGAVDPTTGTAVPTYPLGGHPAGHHHNKYI